MWQLCPSPIPRFSRSSSLPSAGPAPASPQEGFGTAERTVRAGPAAPSRERAGAGGRTLPGPPKPPHPGAGGKQHLGQVGERGEGKNNADFRRGAGTGPGGTGGVPGDRTYPVDCNENLPKPRGFGLSLPKEPGQGSTSLPCRFPPGSPPVPPVSHAPLPPLPLSPARGAAPLRPGLGPAPRRHARGSSMETCQGYGAATGTKHPWVNAAIGGRGRGRSQGGEPGAAAPPGGRRRPLPPNPQFSAQFHLISAPFISEGLVIVSVY